MREILFRGKRMDNGEWVEGFLFVRKDIQGKIIDSFIIDDAYEQITAGLRYVRSNLNQECFRVIPETVGQYTGLKDKNGKRIFEGDIIRTHYANTRKNDFVEQVVFHNGRFSSLYELRGPGNGKMWANLPDSVPHLSLDKMPYMEWCEIIGNIHDNPELLEGSEG